MNIGEKQQHKKKNYGNYNFSISMQFHFNHLRIKQRKKVKTFDINIFCHKFIFVN